jgi:hypothetical protein
MKTVDHYSYKGWLVSDKFWKRVLAMAGYLWLAAWVWGIPLMIFNYIMQVTQFS